MDNIIEMSEIRKNFGHVKVLKNLDFILKRGEIHALLGANGAGKSTLIKILGGVHEQSSGKVLIDSEEVNFKNNLESIDKKISVIYQELSLVPTLSVLDNIFLGREIKKKNKFLDEKEMENEYNQICKEFDFDIKANIIVSDLSIAEQQMVEIMKAVSRNAEIIIMDEPTTSLTTNEKKGLFRIVKKLKNDGKSVIYISHVLSEIFEICDSASIMRNGLIVGRFPIEELTRAKIAKLMTGSDHNLTERKDYNYSMTNSTPVLQAKNLSKGTEIRNVSFNIFPGEVVGFAGLVGSKRSEIVNLIYGYDKMSSGEIYIEGELASINNSKQAIEKGIGLIPEDRKNKGLILKQEIYKNSTAIQLEKFKRNGFLSKEEEIAYTHEKIKQLSILVDSPNQLVSELSGGNQQKIVISKWLGQDLKLIIYDEPTKGIDIGAKEDVFDTVEAFSKAGVGVLFISSDLEEVIRVSDRIYTVRNGEIIDEIEGNSASVQKLMDSIFDVKENENE